jgi:ABC-type multidrug transport system fused ATPase/permease subunit
VQSKILDSVSVILSTQERKQAIILMLMALGGAVAEAVGIGAVLPFIALLSNPDAISRYPILSELNASFGASSTNYFMMACALALLLVFYLKNAYLGSMYFMQSKYVSNLEANLARRLLASYLNAPYTDRHARHSSDRVRLITNETGRVTIGFIMPLLVMVTEGLVVLGMAILLFWFKPTVTLVAITLLAVAGLLLQRVLKRHLEYFRDARIQSNTEMHKWISQIFGALKDIKAIGRERHFLGRFGESSEVYARTTAAFLTFNLMPRLAIESIAVTALLLAVVFGLSIGMPTPEMVSMLTLFGLAAIRIMPSAARIMGALNSIRFFVPSVHDIAADLRAVEALSVLPVQVQEGGITATLQVLSLHDVSYRYPGAERNSLSNINLAVKRGDVLGVVGRSGSGKTTLADLLLGLIEPDSGEIRLDGAPVLRLAARMRSLVGLVPQQFYLLDDSVRRNVAFGREDYEIDDDKVWMALERAQIAERVRRLPEQLDAVIREQGGILSGGERQRLSIARALYDSPAILVLDEATSALDAETEGEFVSVLNQLATHTAIVLITHRPGSMAACDRIIVMAEGSIVEEGTYAELVERSSELRKLATEQSPDATPAGPT